MKKNSLTEFFDDFAIAPECCKKRKGDKVDEFECFNKQIATNEEQKTAIKNIVNCTAYPFHYVCFCPPVTGKTSCLVDCIAKILAEKEPSLILVTAQSNSACDEVGERLLKYV
jgi:primosomal protein N'